MTNEPWNGEAFRKGMARAERNATQYADEHRRRLRLKSPTGRASVADEYDGNALAAFLLSNDARTESRDELLALLDDMEKRNVPMDEVKDRDAFMRGFRSRVRETKAGLVPHKVR